MKQDDHYKACLAAGDAYCRYVVQRLNAAGVAIQFVEGYQNQLIYGDTDRGIEIKFDRRYHETRNLYIEIQETTATGGWVESGIYRRDRCRWYGIGDYRVLWIYTKAALIAEHVRLGRPSREISLHTSRGFLISPLDVRRVRECFWDNVQWDGSPFDPDITAADIHW